MSLATIEYAPAPVEPGIRSHGVPAAAPATPTVVAPPLAPAGADPQLVQTWAAFYRGLERLYEDMCATRGILYVGPSESRIMEIAGRAAATGRSPASTCGSGRLWPRGFGTGWQDRSGHTVSVEPM